IHVSVTSALSSSFLTSLSILVLITSSIFSSEPPVRNEMIHLPTRVHMLPLSEQGRNDFDQDRDPVLFLRPRNGLRRLYRGFVIPLGFLYRRYDIRVLISLIGSFSPHYPRIKMFNSRTKESLH